LAICYDIWCPEVARQLAGLGAEFIVAPTQTTTCDREQELILIRAAAIANQVFLVSANAAAPIGTGRSLIVDPEGRVRAQAGDAE
jgi:predicted amidohydrolase